MFNLNLHVYLISSRHLTVVLHIHFTAINKSANTLRIIPQPTPTRLLSDIIGYRADTATRKPKRVRVDILSTRVQRHQPFLHVLLLAPRRVSVGQDAKIGTGCWPGIEGGGLLIFKYTTATICLAADIKGRFFSGESLSRNFSAVWISGRDSSNLYWDRVEPSSRRRGLPLSPCDPFHWRGMELYTNFGVNFNYDSLLLTCFLAHPG